MEIMKASSIVPCVKFGLFSVAIALPTTAAFASDLILQKAPPLTVQEAPAYPENLARFHFGAEVKTSPQTTAQLTLSSNGEDNNASEAALLCDDPTIGYELPVGQSTVVVSLASIENVESVEFLNHGAQGSLTIAISNADVPANSPEWHTVSKSPVTNGAFAAKIGPGEAKYVRLTFDVASPGRIAAFGVYATPAISDFTMPRSRKISFANEPDTVALINDNLTDLHLRARGLYASSGDVKQVNKMIDDRPATSYQFAANDGAPTAVIDLGRERTLSRISAIYAAQPGSVDFYVLNNLPAGLPNDNATTDQSAVQKIANVTQRADMPTSLKISAATVASLKPVGSVVSTNEGRASVDFPAVTGRYIMLKWHPATLRGAAFSVAQVAAFGRSKKSVQDAGTSPTPDEAATSSNDTTDGKDVADGKTILDNKDIPAEGPAEAQAPAEGPPPALPQVPPFTFIPQVAPTSP